MTIESELPLVPARLNVTVENVVRWKTRLRGVNFAVSPAADGRTNPLVVGGVVYCVSFSPGFAFALDARTGSVLWRRKLGRLAGPTPYVAGRALFTRSPSELFCMERDDGRIRWSFRPYETEGESLYTSPVIHAGRVIVADRRGTAHALDVRTGRGRWAADVGAGASVNCTPLNDGGTLVFGTNGREAVAISAEDGSVRWRTPLDGPCTTRPCLIDGAIVLHTQRVVYWLDPRNGRVRAHWTARATIKSSGAVGGRLFVVVANGDAALLHRLRRGRSLRELPHPGFATNGGLRHDARAGVVYDTRIMGLGILDARTGERLVDIRGFEGFLGTPFCAAGSTFAVDENVVYALSNRMIRRAERLGKPRGR